MMATKKAKTTNGLWFYYKYITYTFLKRAEERNRNKKKKKKIEFIANYLSNCIL